MMNYEEFVGMVRDNFMNYMPEEFKGRELVINKVEKVNQTLDGLTVRENTNGKSVSPTIYINDMYRRFNEGASLETVFKEASDRMVNAILSNPVANIDFSTAKENIVFQLINTEQNREMLKNMPSREFQDLSVVYRWVIANDENGMQSAVITDGLANQLGLNEEELFKLAAENTRRINPPVVKSMNDIMKEMFLKDGMPPEMIEMMIADIPPEGTMYVVTNKSGINGASSMLYEDKLFELATKLDSDLYIMPSSIHETICVSTSMGNPEELAAMVAEVNMTNVELNERLSNQVYFYDKDLRKLTMATDTPNKRLDGIVAEAPMIYESKVK